MNTYLRVGPDRDHLYTINVEVVTLSFALKDITNYGKRNTSFSKPFSIPKNKDTDKIFMGLHNVNRVSGYDITQKVYGELVQDGVIVLAGNIQVVEITQDTYEVVLAGNNVSLFADIADKLIVGNTLSADDITFDGSYIRIIMMFQRFVII